jgi:peptidoglycan/LPS O-acetylase OafA/YrhL
MSLVMHEKYQHMVNGTRQFYLSRALRIYPTHIIVLGLFAVLYGLHETSTLLLGDFPKSLSKTLHALFSNTFILGVEILPMINPKNWNVVIGPTWSLSIELYFYLLAPFIVLRSLRALLAILIFAAILRGALVAWDVPLIPWRYYFFPADLVFFLMGCCSYRLYAVLKNFSEIRPMAIIASILLALCSCLPLLWGEADLDALGAWVFYFTVALTIPFLFALTKDWKLDRWLGNMAYPVYLCHMPVFVWMVLYQPLPAIDRTTLGLISIALLSAILHSTIEWLLIHLRANALWLNPHQHFLKA